MPDAPTEAIACENCQTIDEDVRERRTTAGRRPLCIPCYTDTLSDTRLSDREAEVYAYAHTNYANEAIAAALDLDASTVASHLASVRRKFGDAVQMTELIEPAAATSSHRSNEFAGTPPEGLEPGVVVELDEPSIPATRPDAEYTHGIVRRVLSRSNAGVPTRVAVYPFNPKTGTIRIASHAGMPSVSDQHTDFLDVVFPQGVLLKDLDSEA